MKNGQFKLTNQFGKEVSILLEPEGTQYTLAVNDSIILESATNDSPVYEMKISADASGLILAIWPHTGSFTVVE